MLRPQSLAAAVLMAALILTSSAHAGLVVSLANVTGPVGGLGTFEVLLSNTDAPGGQTQDVASFAFALTIPAGSGVQITAADIATTSAPYIFDGTGGASVDPGFTLSLDPFPNASFAASDTEFASSGIAIHPGHVFGLGLISYSVASDAPAGDVQISFFLAGTSLSDPSGAAIVFSTDDRAGIIPINTIPEPSSLILAVGAGGTFLLAWGYGRVRKKRIR